MIPFPLRSEPGLFRTRTFWVVPRVALAAALTLPSYAASAQGAVLQVAAGSEHICAVVAGGRAKCWGDNSSGQLGDGTTIDCLTPATVNRSPA